MFMPCRIDPGALVNADGIDHQSVALPLADRMAEKLRVEVLGLRTSIQVDQAEGALVGVSRGNVRLNNAGNRVDWVKSLSQGKIAPRADRVDAKAVPAVMDLNIVLQRLESPPTERFDLIIATNILVYYDVFEQSLALTNMEAMLRPGGFLLSNNALLELPSSRMHSAGYLTVVYSARPNDGDHIVWYQRKAD